MTSRYNPDMATPGGPDAVNASASAHALPRWLRDLSLLMALAALPAAGLVRPACAQTQLPFTSLDEYIADLDSRIPRAGSEAFVEPSAAEQTAFAVCFQAMLRGDDTAAQCLAPLGYDLYTLVDRAALRTWWVAAERAIGFRGQGTFVVDPFWARDTMVVAPHPIFDTATSRESAAIVSALDARVLIVAGVHRCSNAAVSPCDGTTSACGGPSYRVSDAAHYEHSFVQAAHQAALAGSAPPPRAWSIHGNSAEPVDVELSDGVSTPRPADAEVNRLRDALLARGVSAGSCKWPADTGLSMCGGTNVSGRLYNGSTDVCETAAATGSGRFLHIEQRIGIRNAPQTLIAAMSEVFAPERLILLAVRGAGADVILRFAASSTPLTVTRDVSRTFTLTPTTAPSNGPTWIDATPVGSYYYKVE